MLYRLDKSLIKEMILDAKSVAPEECCAILGGTKDTFTHYYKIKNTAFNRKKNYLADPFETFQVLIKMYKEGQDLLGIYHSHPNSSAYPSKTDIQLALYPKAVYFIFSLHPKEELAAFSILENKVIPLEILEIIQFNKNL